MDTVKNTLLVLLLGGLLLLGWYTKTVYDDRTQVKNDLAAATDANKSLVEENTGLRASQQVTDVVVTKNAEEQTTLTTNANTIEEKVQVKVVTIREKYKTQPVTETSKVQEAMEVSRARLEGAWATYCLGFPQQAECATYANREVQHGQ